MASDMKKNYSIVSPMTPNGVTYLLNIFLELNICIYRCEDPKMGPAHTTWRRDGRKFVIKENEYKDLARHLPSLRPDAFVFDASPLIHWDHPVDMNLYDDFGLIVFARDPRDALYSWYRRTVLSTDEKDKPTFEKFLQSPSRRFPEIWKSIQKKFERDDLLFRAYWLNSLDRYRSDGYGDQIDEHIGTYELVLGRWVDGDESTALLRFEDVKSTPKIHIKNLLNFIGVARDMREINNAICSSSFERAHIRERDTSKATQRVNFKGKSFEHLENKSENTSYDLIRNRCAPLFELLVY
jgi:hypothetical protein